MRSCVACPCCDHLTLAERGAWHVCPVCLWEDDGQDERTADECRGGPNGMLSLMAARANYRSFGACERRHLGAVRAALPDEVP